MKREVDSTEVEDKREVDWTTEVVVVNMEVASVEDELAVAGLERLEQLLAAPLGERFPVGVIALKGGEPRYESVVFSGEEDHFWPRIT